MDAAFWVVALFDIPSGDVRHIARRLERSRRRRVNDPWGKRSTREVRLKS
jgi:hypothetical protein